MNRKCPRLARVDNQDACRLFVVYMDYIFIALESVVGVGAHAKY